MELLYCKVGVLPTIVAFSGLLWQTSFSFKHIRYMNGYFISPEEAITAAETSTLQ